MTTTAEAMADVIRKEAMRRYMNDAVHRAQVRLAVDLVKQPAEGVSEQARQLVRTGALIASSLALVVADKEFMASVEGAVDDEAAQLVERMMQQPAERRVFNL